MRQDAVTRDRRYGPLMAKRSEGRKEGLLSGVLSVVLVCHAPFSRYYHVFKILDPT